MGIKLTSLEKLDIVLNFVNKWNRDKPAAKVSITSVELFSELYKIYGEEITHKDFTGIMFKLNTDKNIEYMKIEGVEYCFPHFNGQLLQERGGYAKQYESSDAEIARKKSLDDQSVSNARRLNYLTAALGVATFFAAAPLVMEYYEKHFLNICWLLYFLSGLAIGLLLQPIIQWLKQVKNKIKYDSPESNPKS